MTRKPIPLRNGEIPTSTELRVNPGSIDDDTKAESEWIKEASPLLTAMRRGHFLLYGQKISLLSGSAQEERPYQEILIRYLEEERGLLPPGMFFSVLEELGLMSLLDHWVVYKLLAWHALFLVSRTSSQAPRNSLNLSIDCIVDPSFPDFLRTQMKNRNAPPDLLSFEIQENVALLNADAVSDLIGQLNSTDCTFAISRYSGSEPGLKLIAELPISYLKIDASLTRGIQTDRNALLRVARLQERCRELGIRTIAESVEDPQVLAALRVAGVDYAQGYAIAAPAPLFDG